MVCDIDQQLRAAGIAEEDIEATSYLQQSLLFMHQIMFPRAPCTLQISRRVSEKGFIATYAYENDRYMIFVPGVFQRLQKIYKLDFFLADSQGLLLENARTNLTLYEKCLLVSAHEVRHRMQHKTLGLRQFVASSLSEHPLVKVIISYVGLLFAETRKCMQNENLAPEFIEERNNDAEFDSNVAELWVMHQLKNLRTLEALREAMLLQPDA